MVTASGSGLDPHITLDNAMYQLDRVTSARAAKAKRDQSQIRQQIEKLLQDKAEAPLNGIVGEKLVNVLEVNLALDDMK
jgi:K+-transporting ATPase ATPase C chain